MVECDDTRLLIVIVVGGRWSVYATRSEAVESVSLISGVTLSALGGVLLEGVLLGGVLLLICRGTLIVKEGVEGAVSIPVDTESDVGWKN